MDPYTPEELEGIKITMRTNVEAQAALKIRRKIDQLFIDRPVPGVTIGPNAERLMAEALKRQLEERDPILRKFVALCAYAAWLRNDL